MGTGINFDIFKSFEIILHYAILFLQAVYIMIAFIQTRQVKLMNSSFKTPQAGVFRIVAQLHLLAAIGIFFVSLMLLL